jgi:hypothetical protein
MRPTRCILTVFLIARIGLPVEPQQQATNEKTSKSAAKPKPAGGVKPQASQPGSTANAPRAPAPNTASGQTASPPPAQDDHTARDAAIAAAAAAGAAVGIAVLVHSHTPMNRLSKNGPEFSSVFQMSAFRVKGLVKGGWPLVVDYDAAAGTLALLTVTTDRAQPHTQILETQPPQRRFVILTVPPAFGNELKDATFSITATAGPNDPRPSYFRVYGFGCGPKAVGSVAIDNLRFSPLLVTSGNPNTNFGFRARTYFDKVKAEFMQITLVNSCIEGRVFDNTDIPGEIREEETVQRTWSAKKARPGQIQFRVRGWMNARNGGDWVSAFSPDFVVKQ